MFTLRSLLLLVCIARFPIYETADSYETIVHWYEDVTTIYIEDSSAVLRLTLTKLSPDDITVSLRAFGVGISVEEDITMPETVTIYAGQRYVDVTIGINPTISNEGSVTGNLLLRIRIQEVTQGRADLGGYHYPEIADIHLLGPSTTACRSGSFQNSRISVPEDIGTIYIPFFVNSPFPEDRQLGYTIDLQWTGATHHANHEVDYHYHVSPNHQGEDKYVLLPAGEDVVLIPVTIIDDTQAEETEQFIVRLDHKCLQSYINVLSDYVIVDIEDNDVCTDIPPASRYEHLQNACYFVLTMEDHVTAADAQNACAEYGGDLLSVSNVMENAVAYQLLSVDEGAWIGAHRDPSNSTLFIWPDGSPVDYHSWATGEPDGSQGVEDCVITSNKNMQAVEWSSENCDGTTGGVNSVICEKKANAPGWVY